MKASNLPMIYETPLDQDILEAYFQKHPNYNRAEARKLKRALKRLIRA